MLKLKYLIQILDVKIHTFVTVRDKNLAFCDERN